MKPSKNFIELCHGSEGCRLKAYKDTGGIWTIGFGHTHNVHEGDTCTQDQANQYFIEDCEYFINWLNRWFPVLTQNQFDAILDLIYNIGPGNLSKDVPLFNALHNNNVQEITTGFMRHVYDHNCVKQPGLVIRRKKELTLYFS